MELSATEEIAVPQQMVWERLTEFQRFVELARKRGAEVESTRSAPLPAWTARFGYRKIQREIEVEIVEVEAPAKLVVSGKGSGVGARMTVVLAAKSEARTAMTVVVDVRGTTLAGRMLIQGLTLGKGTLQERFAKRVHNISKEMAKGLA